MFIDIHTHAFHPKIAAKAVAHLNQAYQLRCEGEGTIDDMLRRGRKASLDAFLVLCAATEAAQVIPANNYAITLQREHQEILAFGSVHPDFTDWETQLDRLKKAGIQGIKLHPEFQHFRLDDTRLLPLFDAMQDTFTVAIHIGDRLPPAENPSCPYKMAAILKQFPHLRVIAAHLGGYHQWQHSLHTLVGKPVWLDTSSATPFIAPELLRTILRTHPQEYILFGSDYPLYDQSQEMERLQSLARLSDTQIEQYCTNATKLLNFTARALPEKPNITG